MAASRRLRKRTGNTVEDDTLFGRQRTDFLFDQRHEQGQRRKVACFDIAGNHLPHRGAGFHFAAQEVTRFDERMPQAGLQSASLCAKNGLLAAIFA